MMLRTVTLLALYSRGVFVLLPPVALPFHFLFFSFHFIFFSFYCGKNHLSYYTVGCRRQEYKPLVLCFCFLLPVGAHIGTRRWPLLSDLSYIRLRCHSAQYTYRQCGSSLSSLLLLLLLINRQCGSSSSPALSLFCMCRRCGWYLRICVCCSMLVSVAIAIAIAVRLLCYSLSASP